MTPLADQQTTTTWSDVSHDYVGYRADQWRVDGITWFGDRHRLGVAVTEWSVADPILKDVTPIGSYHKDGANRGYGATST